MDIWSIDKFFLFILFFIPGFISIKIYSLIIPQRRTSHYTELLDAIFYSSLNYTIFSWLIYLNLYYKFYDNYKIVFIISCIIILVIFPIILPIIFINIRKLKFLRKHIIDPTSKPWDYVFNKREPYWMIVYLINGTKIGGLYSNKSFSSSYPEEDQIYLEQVWRLDENEGFIVPVDSSKGIIILNKEISYIQLFERKKE